jgi:hypothetical protein
MKANIHILDRVLRVLIAIVCFVLYFNNIIGGALGVTLVAVGVVFVLTAFIGFCPIYRAFGFSTKKKQNPAH